MKVWWSKVRAQFGLASFVLWIGLVVAFLSKHHAGPALIGLATVYVAVVLLIGPLGRLIGLPAFRPDEAYSDTLRHWHRRRRSAHSRK
jgi:hypothetical protein